LIAVRGRSIERALGRPNLESRIPGTTPVKAWAVGVA
jgi:hypothetical protein